MRIAGPTSLCGGFIALHRSILENPIFQAPDAWLKVWLWVLLKANWRDQKFRDGMSDITVPRGSFITSLDSITRSCGVTRRQARSALAYLNGAQMVAITTTHKYTLVSVVNYEKYQNVWTFDGMGSDTDHGLANGTERG